MTKEPKKDVNACINFIYTIVKGHFLACACEESLVLPPAIESSSAAEKLAFIMKISRLVVERCSLIEGCLTNETVADIDDGVYNYARTLCHYGSLVMEFRDAWQEGDGEGPSVLETVFTTL